MLKINLKNKIICNIGIIVYSCDTIMTFLYLFLSN